VWRCSYPYIVDLVCVSGAIVLAASVQQKLHLIDPLAPYVYYARIGQTLAHLSGVGQANVFVRANFFFVQLVLYGLMIYKLI
jgi:hypothetical protein